MLNNDYPGQECSIARSLEIVGERWTLLIVRELIRGPGRFSEIERATGIAKNVLTKRLTRMASDGLIESVSVSEARDWVEYRLTSKGKALFPILHALIAWGDVYASPDGPPLTLIHTCGGQAGHNVVCECCGGPITLGAIKAIQNRPD